MSLVSSVVFRITPESSEQGWFCILVGRFASAMNQGHGFMFGSTGIVNSLVSGFVSRPGITKTWLRPGVRFISGSWRSRAGTSRHTHVSHPCSWRGTFITAVFTARGGGGGEGERLARGTWWWRGSALIGERWRPSVLWRRTRVLPAVHAGIVTVAEEGL